MNYGSPATNRPSNANSNQSSAEAIEWVNTEEDIKKYWDNAPPELIPWEVRFFRWQDANEKKHEGTNAWAFAFIFLAFLFGSIWLFGTYGEESIAFSKHWILIQALPMSILALITNNWFGQLLDDLKKLYVKKLESVVEFKIPFEAEIRGYTIAASSLIYAVIVHATSFKYWFLAFVISLFVTPITFFPLRIYLTRPNTITKYLEQAAKAEVERAAADAIKIETQANWNAAEKARVKRWNAEWAERNAAVMAVVSRKKLSNNKQNELKDVRNKLEDALARLAEVVDKVFSLPLDSQGVQMGGSNKIPESLDKALRDAFSDVSNCLSACQGFLTRNQIGHHQSGLYNLRTELAERFGFQDI
jgi:hypothetical protein